MRIAITGANSSVGQNLLAHLSTRDDVEVMAGIRSASAREKLPQSNKIDSRVISYDNVSTLASNLADASTVVHLAGILIEGKGSSYQSANVDATAAVVEAAKQAKVRHIVFISVVGADVNSPNAYFRSKGEAERLVADSGLAATIIRTPILLGQGTAGFAAIRAAAKQGKASLLGGGRYSMRPLDVDDLSKAIIQSCEKSPQAVATHELVGPQAIPYHELITTAAGLLGKKVSIGSTPIVLAKLLAGITSRLRGGGISPAVIDVITMNEIVAKNGDQDLGISLTPLNDTLKKLLVNKKN